jgi:hypothetical protein
MKLKHQQKLTHQQLSQEKKLELQNRMQYHIVTLDGSSRAKSLMNVFIVQIKFTMPGYKIISSRTVYQ